MNRFLKMLAAVPGCGFLAALLVAAQAHAACVPAIESADSSAFVPYSIVDRDDGVDQLRFRVANKGDETCTVQFSYFPRGAHKLRSPLGGQALDYLILDPAGVPIDENASPRSTGGSLTVQPGEARDYELDFVVPAGQIVRSGPYDALVLLRVFALEVDKNTAFQEVDLSLAAEVAPIVRVSIAGGASGGTSGVVVDFGTLEEGEQKRLALRILSNDDFQVSFRSENAGNLRHETVADQLVPYSMKVAGQPINLASSDTLDLRGPTPAQGLLNPIQIRIGEVAGRQAGQYRDTVTVDVVAGR